MVKIKICGITNIDDYNYSVNLKADYTGFIFYKKSPRNITKEQAKKIIDNGIKAYNKKVGVFVDEDPETIKRIFYSIGLDIVQLHGHENPDYCEKLSLPYWKVIHVKDRNSIEEIKNYSCKTVLLDTWSKTKLGGTGTSFDLSLIEKAARTEKQIIVAGGVSAENITDILRYFPLAVDINSSIEKTPGKKDPDKLKQIIEKIKNYRA